MIPFLRPLILTALMLLPVSVKPERTGDTVRSPDSATRCRAAETATIGTPDKSAEKLTDTGFIGREVLKNLQG